MKVVMDRDQRDAMYRFVICDLDGEDVAGLLKEGKVKKAHELRRRFDQGVWLLDQLGWVAVGVHDRYEVEFSQGNLPILARFRVAAEAVVDESDAGFDDQALIDALYVNQVYDRVFGGSEADAPSS
jgi:hypothetical protein